MKGLLSEFFIWLGKRLVGGKEGNVTEEEACLGGKGSSKSKTINGGQRGSL